MSFNDISLKPLILLSSGSADAPDRFKISLISVSDLAFAFSNSVCKLVTSEALNPSLRNLSINSPALAGAPLPLMSKLPAASCKLLAISGFTLVYFFKLACKESLKSVNFLVVFVNPSEINWNNLVKAKPPTIPIAEKLLAKLPDRKSANGAKLVANTAVTFWPKSYKVVAKRSIDAAVEVPEADILENLRAPSSVTALTKA